MIPKILVSYVHRPMCVGLFFKCAFRQAGADVRSVGPSLPQVYGHTFPESDYMAPDYEVAESRPVEITNIESYVALAQRPHDWAPDAIVWIDQYDEYVPVGQPSVPWAHVAVENWNVQQAARAGARSGAVEYYMISHDSNGTETPPVVPNGATFLPFGFDPFIHPIERPLTAPRSKVVCQIGSAYDPRPQVWDSCRAWLDQEPPLGAEPYRHGLMTSARTAFGRAPSYRAFARVYNDSYLALSCSNVDFIPMRVPEAMGMGCVLVSDDVPSIRKVFGPPWATCVNGSIEAVNPRGTWLSYDRSPNSLKAIVEGVARGIERDEAANLLELRERALAQVYAEHTYCHRARQILADLGLGEARAYRMT